MSKESKTTRSGELLIKSWEKLVDNGKINMTQSFKETDGQGLKGRIVNFEAIQRVAERLASYVTDIKCNGCHVSKPPHAADCTYFREAQRLIEGNNG